jgi:DNA-directed RNA polymerase subunit RPC12/RpoP
VPARDNMLDIELIKKSQREDAVVFCICGTQMVAFAEQRYDGWKCPNCGRKRTVISDHRKNPTRWPEEL